MLRQLKTRRHLTVDEFIWKTNNHDRSSVCAVFRDLQPMVTHV